MPPLRIVATALLLLFLTACRGRDPVAPPPAAPAPGSNAELATLVLSAGTLSPAFAAAVLEYAATVAAAVAEVTVSATAVDPAATITVNGEAVASGAASSPVVLGFGASTVLVIVLAADGTTTSTYTLTVTRVPPPRLSDLTVSAGTLAPAFAPDTTTYEVAVGFLVPTISVTPSTTVAGATITVAGQVVGSGQTSAGIALAEGGNPITVRVTSELLDSTDYVLTVQRADAAAFAQQAYVKASNTGAADEFGFAVALHGDTLAVGAYREDSSATGIGGNQGDNGAGNSGAVYVFTRTGSTWAQQAYVKASNTGASDFFGQSVALSGDTLVVGAYLEDSSATGVGGNQADNGAPASGAVYVFTRTAGVWTQQAYIKASNTEAGDAFGINVALAGDTLAVGAYQEDSSATGIGGNQTDNAAANSGAVYVFTRSDGTWTQVAYVKASNTEANDQFGLRVALTADTLAASSFEEDSNATGIDGNQADNSAPDSGAVYLFTDRDGTWTQAAYVKASNTEAGDRFGVSVDVANDTLVVGAYDEDSSATGVDGDQGDNGAPGSGAVYVFARSGGTWTQQAYVKASNTEAGDLFGQRVALHGETLVAGAPMEDSNAGGINGNQASNGAPGSGAVYVRR